MKPIFPEFFVNIQGDECMISTYVRKRHRGKWYLIPVKTFAHIDIDNHHYLDDVLYAMQAFTREVTKCHMLFKINSSLVDSDGLQVIKLDQNQIDTEEQRIAKTYITNPQP